MYELVNTSLPNGLIAGTHGFATVAMTKGVPDILRGRLEALCAYTHRTSVHDATYYQQNPVNWFHVALPQGEHVVGRVAPSDFDYTGRTNRLARLRVFSVNEMPAVGGAEILAREKHWFVQPWQGDPRYLDEDRNTCGHLRMINPARFSDAPAWNSVFGSGGSRYAQQVAWQIEKNLASGGKTIYFKTSTTWDASGEKLLGLFVDVINLLPVEMRPRVTFSTYPVSLPGGTGCSLRGIYDRDKSFDASSATQAWIDCENAKVVHAELLPTSGFDRKTETKNAFGSRDVGIGTTGQFRSDASAQRIGVRRSPSSGGDPYAYRNLIASQKKGSDMLVVGLVIASLISLLAVGGGVFFWWVRGESRKIEAVKEEARCEEEKNEADAKEESNAKRKQEFETQYELLKGWIEGKHWDYQSINEKLEALANFSEVEKPAGYGELIRIAQKFCSVYKAYEEVKRHVEALRKKGDPLPASRLDELKRQIEELKKEEAYGLPLAELAADVDKLPSEKPTTSQSGRKDEDKPTGSDGNLAAQEKQGFLASATVRGATMSSRYKSDFEDAREKGNTFTAYYYTDRDGCDSLTNEVAGFESKLDPITKRVADYKLWVRNPRCKLSVIGKSHIVLWKCMDNVWFDWSQYETKRSLWFKEHESHDLQKECFGMSGEVFDAWNKAYPVTYLVTWGDEDGHSVECKSREFKIKDAVDAVCKAEIERLKMAVYNAEKDIADNEESIGTVKKEIAALDDQLADYVTETNKLAKLKVDLKVLRDDRQAKKKANKFDDKAEEKFKNDQRELNKQITGQEAIVDKMNIKSVKVKADARKQKLKQLEDGVEPLKQKLEKKRVAYEMALKDPDREKRVRDSSFGVTVKGVN